MNLKEQIKELRAQKLTYQQIADLLKCSKGTVCYYINPKQKLNTRIRARVWKSKNVLKNRIFSFLYRKERNSRPKTIKSTSLQALKYKIYNFFDGEYMSISVNQIIEQLEANPFCYLTGEKIDLTQPQTYELDHKIPKSKGGLNDLNNLGLCTTQVNRAKYDSSVDEFVAMCKKVVEHNKSSG